MKKIERLVGVIYTLKENTRLTAKEIARIFEVSERTVYRDIDALSQLKIPIRAYEGFDGGYEIDESYFVPSISFKDYEVLYLLICLKLGDIIKLPNMQVHYESLKYKLLNILDTNTKKQYQQLLERIDFAITDMTFNGYMQDITEKILQSFFDYKDLIIEYYTPKNDECLKRRITSYSLIFCNGGWYLKSYCHLKKAKRMFRLDRIRDIKVSTESHSINDINEHLQELGGNDDAIKVVLQVNKRLYETIKNDSIFNNADIDIKSNEVYLTFYTCRMNYIINLAVRNFNDVQIIKPQHYIDHLKQVCKNILEKY